MRSGRLSRTTCPTSPTCPAARPATAAPPLGRCCPLAAAWTGGARCVQLARGGLGLACEVEECQKDGKDQRMRLG